MPDRARLIAIVASLIALSCLAACASDAPAATGSLAQSDAGQPISDNQMTPHGY